MLDQAYRELARKLDSIPSGFPATESGVELELLARIYTPEEARLISVMRLAHEAAGDIASRAGMEPGASYRILRGAARKGLVQTRPGEHAATFALNPQTGGFAGYHLGVPCIIKVDYLSDCGLMLELDHIRGRVHIEHCHFPAKFLAGHCCSYLWRYTVCVLEIGGVCLPDIYREGLCQGFCLYQGLN